MAIVTKIFGRLPQHMTMKAPYNPSALPTVSDQLKPIDTLWTDATNKRGESEKINDDDHKHLLDLLKKMTTLDPSNRMTIGKKFSIKIMVE